MISFMGNKYKYKVYKIQIPHKRNSRGENKNTTNWTHMHLYLRCMHETNSLYWNYDRNFLWCIWWKRLSILRKYKAFIDCCNRTFYQNINSSIGLNIVAGVVAVPSLSLLLRALWKWYSGLILRLRPANEGRCWVQARPANEKRCYLVTTSLICWMQA